MSLRKVYLKKLNGDPINGILDIGLQVHDLSTNTCMHADNDMNFYFWTRDTDQKIHETCTKCGLKAEIGPEIRTNNFQDINNTIPDFPNKLKIEDLAKGFAFQIA